MSAFRGIVDSIGRGEDGGVMYPETFLDDIGAAYDTDFAGATAESAAKDGQIAELTAALQQAQAANWQLLQQVQAGAATIPGDVEDNGDGDGDGNNDEDNEDDDPDTEDFFRSADK